ncbi:iron-sulfur cluster assembly scaffold protein [Tsuneonella sp. HG222]
MAADRLYTPELLALAVTLGDVPPDPALPLHGSARSKSCGSTLDIDLGLDGSGAIEKLGMRVRACAVGQAAAAIFAAAAPGHDAGEIEAAHGAIGSWLAGEGDLPDWPGFAPLIPARDFPARHGAILLPWNAARDALSSAAPAS